MSTTIINTESFHKFITTISLVASIYFFSFHALYIKPFNQEHKQCNIELSNIVAEHGYTTGLVEDLRTICDGHLSTSVTYHAYDPDKNSYDTFKYYRNTILDSFYAPKIDSLNRLQRRLAILNYTSIVLNGHINVLEKNLREQELAYHVLGGITSIIFFIFSYRWFLTERKRSLTKLAKKDVTQKVTD